MSKWKYTSYLKKGLSHEKAGTKCQDSVIVQEDEHCIVAALADGLGSLKYSDVAASTATLTVWELFASLGHNRITIESDEGKQAFAKDIIQRIAQKINDKAVGMGVPTSTMDCTLVFVYISKDHNYAITGRLGDSAICIITKDGSIAINDSNQSANGTSAILDEDAHEHMEISFWDIEADKIYGFILTSDGLDNELYRKGSVYVNKAAEDYFNSVVISTDPKEVIQSKIAELTAEEDSPFDDDISIAVINRATAAISFPDDPTWLCTCGERNRLQDTYCYKCGKDFSVLYQNVRFKEYGGKTAFFLEINKRPDEEARVIGLHTKATQRKPNTNVTTDLDDFELITHQSKNKRPQVKTTEESTERPVKKPRTDPGETSSENGKEVKRVTKKEKPIGNQRQRNNFQLLSVVGIICIVIGLACGSTLARMGMSKNIRELSGKIDALTDVVQSFSEKVNDNPDTAEPENTETETTPVVNEPIVIIPEDILVNDDGVYYWGETEDDLPHGQGIYLKAGYYYMGQFVEGKKVGKFVITPNDDPTRNIIVVYVNDEIATNDLSFDQYVVRYSSLNVRSHAGLDSDIVAELEKGDVVFRTDATSVIKDGKEWVEIINGDSIIGWVAIDAVEMEAI